MKSLSLCKNVCLTLALRAGLLAALLAAPALSGAEPATTWRAGAARVAITPGESMWMAGYASRNKPSEGAIHDLYAKALALEDGVGTRLVIVTTDLIGIPRELRDRLERTVMQNHQIPPAGLLLNASHTHCGPELRASKTELQGLDEAQSERSRRYFAELQTKLETLIATSLQELQPARLHYSHGRAGFAMNRRLPVNGRYENRPNPEGPVDHEVPVLQVQGDDGTVKALLFGYACHNTTLSFYQFCGDYAGFAQQYLQEAHPEATALFLTGCGGDQNPQPRGTVELAQQHGRTLANGVEAALLGPPRPVHGPLRLAYEHATLEFADPPTQGELEKLAQSSDPFDQRRAQALLQQLRERGSIARTYEYPIQVARFGNDLILLALAGEVVVDYALRLKQEGDTPLWVAGYSNDVFGYVPSRRVLEEGGYEGGGAMRFTTLPGPFAPNIEQLIVAKTRELLERVSAP